MKAFFASSICTMAFAIACFSSEQGAGVNVPASTEKHPTERIPLPADSRQEIDFANARLGERVVLPKEHLKHEKFEEVETLLEQALADPIATEKRAAILLLDKAKMAKQRTQVDEDKQPQIFTKVQHGQPKGVTTGVPDPERTEQKRASKSSSKVVDGPVFSQATRAANEKPRQAAVKQPATDALISELERKARRADTANEALALYDEFLDRYVLTEQQTERVNSRRKIWKEKADQGLVRLGAEWVKPQEAEAAAQEADSLIAQAFELIKVSNFKDARQFLERASKIDQNGIRADFILGILNSIPYAFNYPKTAEKHFRTVLARSPNHIAALNNLALAEVKLRKFSAALNHWRQDVNLLPKTPEVTQNLGRFISEASKRKLLVPALLLRKFSTLYSQTIASGKGKAANPQVGWLYMPLILPKSEKKREQDSNRKSATGRLIALGSGTGFVFHKAYILTNRHVVEDKDFGVANAIRIVDPTDPKHERELEAEVVALADDLDLAILKCEKLKAPAVPLSVEIPRRASEILVLGYPETQAIGRSLKATKGIVTALPDEAHENMLLFDVEANHGNSGGPVCNNYGKAVAVITIKYAERIGKYTGGIPSAYALPFIQQHVPKFIAKKSAGPKLEWPRVDEKVSKSTIMLIAYYKEVALGLAIAATKRNEKGNYLEDRSCTACNGRGYVPCPAKGCARGAISVKVPYSETTGVGVGRRVIKGFRTVKRRCAVCGGKGRVPCRYGR